MWLPPSGWLQYSSYIKPIHCQHKPLTLQSWFLFAGFIGHKTIQLALDHALSLQTSSVTSDCHPPPSHCWWLPFPASTSNTSTGLEHNLCAAAITGSKQLWKYRWIKLVSPLSSAELLQTSWYSKAFICHVFMMKRRRFVYFWWKSNIICANSEDEIWRYVKIELVFFIIFYHRVCFPATYSLFYVNWSWPFLAFVSDVNFHCLSFGQGN